MINTRHRKRTVITTSLTTDDIYLPVFSDPRVVYTRRGPRNVTYEVEPLDLEKHPELRDPRRRRHRRPWRPRRDEEQGPGTS